MRFQIFTSRIFGSGFFLFAFCIFGLATNNQSVAQDNDQTESKRKVVEFADRYDERFAQQQPKIGMRVPDANGFDEEGNPFSIKDTRGKFTVFVFGCNT